MNEIIAERHLLYSVKGNDERKDLLIRIGKPYWIEDKTAACCPVEWSDIYRKLMDIHGIDLIQALNLASNIDPWLEQMRDQYDFFFSDGEPYFD